jgi:hypothetical protein
MKFGNIMCLHAGSRSSGNVFSGRKRLGDEIATVGGGTQDLCPSAQAEKRIGTENEEDALINIVPSDLEFRYCCWCASWRR